MVLKSLIFEWLATFGTKATIVVLISISVSHAFKLLVVGGNAMDIV